MRTIDQQWRLAPHQSCAEARIFEPWAPERIAPVHLPLFVVGIAFVLAGIVGKVFG